MGEEMTPEQRIENAKQDARGHMKTLPDFMWELEKSNEGFKYLSLRLADHIRVMGKEIEILTAAKEG